MDSFCGQKNLFFLRIFIQVLPLGCQLQTDSSNARLIATTASVSIQLLLQLISRVLVLLAPVYIYILATLLSRSMIIN